MKGQTNKNKTGVKTELGYITKNGSRMKDRSNKLSLSQEGILIIGDHQSCAGVWLHSSFETLQESQIEIS